MTNHYDHRQNRTSRSSYRGPRKSRRPASETEKGNSLLPLAAAGAGIFLLAAVSAVTISHFKGKPAAGSHETSLSETDASLTAPAVTVNGISLNGLSPDESFEALNQLFPWDMKAEYGEEQLAVENPLSPRLKEWIGTLCRSSQSGDLTLTPANLINEELKKEILIQAETFAKKWETAPKNSGLDYFDPQKGIFIFTEGCSGIEIDERRLAEDILSAIRENRLDAVIPVHSADAAPPLSKAMAKEQYKTIAAFTTETTSNQKRNTNVRLAAEALNGTIVQPGEEFSFNQAVGQRTAEKGYQEAAAYSSGAVVQEIGGGVCQISSTLYRAAFNAGMEITFRRSHTFEPNYVTPGQDAAISWEQPDFRFVNTSSAPIGIRASYADRKATVSIYGLPVLEEGVSWDLYSEKVEELPPPEPEYAEDPSLEPGTEKVVKAAVPGSRWNTYKVISKDGEERERILDHSKTYKGHAAVIHRNTASSETSKAEQTPSAAPYETKTGPEHPASSDPAPAETLPSDAPFVDGMPDSYTPKTNPIIPFQPTASS